MLRPATVVEEGEAEVNFSYKFQDYAKTLASDKLSLISEQENWELKRLRIQLHIILTQSWAALSCTSQINKNLKYAKWKEPQK